MDYEPIARLGRGGMGVVDLARDKRGNRVAMKRLTLHGSANDMLRARQRLLREATVLRRLHHPNIVRLLDVVEENDDIILVMPYLNGGNLSERVGQHGPAPPAEIDRLAQRLLGALATAHAAGIIHRDIKPANVLFDERGEPCLADFGVAHVWDQTEGLTVAGMVVGTPGFMAPEQARDELLTPASDIFSLGATLLYAATGTGPFGNGDPGLLMVRTADSKVEPIPKSLPSGLRRRLNAMVQPRPERRPTAAALLTGDQSALRRPPVRTRLAGTGPAMAFVAFAAAVVLVALTVSTSRDDDSRDGEPTPLPSVDEEAPPSGDGAAGDPEDQGEAELPDDGPAVVDEEVLIDEIDGVVASGEVDTFWLPMGSSAPGLCPRRVTLTVTAQRALAVEVVQSSSDQTYEDLVTETRTDGEEPTRIDFVPESCDQPDLGYVVRLREVGAGDEPIPYRIMREDS